MTGAVCTCESLPGLECSVHSQTQVTPQDAIKALVGQTVRLTLLEPSEVEGKYKKRTVEGKVDAGDTEMLWLCINVVSSTVQLEDE